MITTKYHSKNKKKTNLYSIWQLFLINLIRQDLQFKQLITFGQSMQEVDKTFPEYCQKCSWLFSKMGACQPPNVSIFFSYISLLPYIIIGIFILLALFSRGSRQIKMAMLLITGYLIADKIIKNIVGMGRPEGSCRTSYGFPSSHMVVLCCYAFQMFPYCRKSQKLFFIFLVLSQAMARVHLKYHTWTQVIGGAAYALIYTVLFSMAWEKIQKHQKVKNFYAIFGVKQYDYNKKRKAPIKKQ